MNKYKHYETRCANLSCGKVFEEGDIAVMVLWQYEGIFDGSEKREKLEATCIECAKEMRAKEIERLKANQATENCPYRLQNCGVCP